MKRALEGDANVGGDEGAEGGNGGARRNRRGARGNERDPDAVPNKNSWQSDIPGFKDALNEAFASAGIGEEEDLEEITKKVDTSARKQSNKFYNDPRAQKRMNAAEAKSFLGEYIEAMMGALSNTLYEKPWFEKVSWNGVILMVVLWAFETGKIFTRLLKSQLIEVIDEGLLAWSEEERCTRAMWKSLEAANIKTEAHMKKVNNHLQKAYDDAHFNAPFGSTQSDSLGNELATLQDFVKGWMLTFAGKAWGALENGLPDSSAGGMAHALTVMFQHLLDPENACLPLSVQPALPPAPWPFIETCATEVIAEITAPK